jgi:hypothetical protein
MIHVADGVDRAREVIRTAVFQIVARHRRDDDMLQIHPAYCLGDALRFILLERERFRGADSAESARTRATFAGNHHRRSPLAPAFPPVRALRALADGVQAQI